MAIHPGSIWIDKNWSQLPEGSWVAVNADGIVHVEKTFQDLLSVVQKKMALALPQVAIAYIPWRDEVIQ